MKKHLLSVIALGVLGGLLMTGTSWSQNPATQATKKSTSQTAPSSASGRADDKPVPISRGTLGGGSALGGGGGLPGGMGTMSGAGSMGRPRSEIEQLMAQLREADDDAKKADLKKQLELAVTVNFEEDMTSRETDLKKLEERLTKLRAQLDRRRKAQAEIIQLQIKVMVNEADGLGFSGASGNKPGLSVMFDDMMRHGVVRKKTPIRLEASPFP